MNEVTETDTRTPPSSPKLGRPYTEIPEPLAALLEESYAAGEWRSVETKGDARAAKHAVRLAGIYVRRKDKTLHHQIDDDRLWLQMADKRPYTKKANR